MEDSSDKCSMCKGTGLFRMDMGDHPNSCQFCNGTGEANSAATSYMKNHICQCQTYDRKNCPVCGVKCHHNTPNRPKLLVGGGFEF